MCSAGLGSVGGCERGSGDYEDAVGVGAEVVMEQDAHFTWLPRPPYQSCVFDSDTATPKIASLCLDEGAVKRRPNVGWSRTMTFMFKVLMFTQEYDPGLRHNLGYGTRRILGKAYSIRAYGRSIYCSSDMGSGGTDADVLVGRRCKLLVASRQRLRHCLQACRSNICATSEWQRT
jgi:hypothetical protein